MILFLAAATGGVLVLLSILASDIKARKKP